MDELENRRVNRWTRVLGAGFGLSAVGLAVTALLLTMTPASAVPKSKGPAHYSVYFETTTRAKTLSLNGVSNLLILSTPSLPGGDYVATGSLVAYTPTVLLSNGKPDTTDYVDCYVARLPNRTSTYDGNRSDGYDGIFALNVADAFMNVSNGTKLGLYCFEEQKTQGAAVDWASLEVTPYTTMYSTHKGA